MVAVVLWVARIAAAVGPTCDQIPNLACAKTAGAIGTVVLTCPAEAVVTGIDALGNLLCQAQTPVRLDLFSGVDCTGNTDSTSGVNTALGTFPNGATFIIPSNCLLRLSTPGSSNTTCTALNNPWPCCTGALAGTCNGPAIALPANTHLQCTDGTGGFAVNHQSCGGHGQAAGTYPGAACLSNADCTGGGVCSDDFGNAATNPCTTCFAPTAGQTYMIIGDLDARGTNIIIDNCSFWTYQASPYQVCSGGTNDGAPCRQECGTGTTPPTSGPGKRCELNTDCPTSNNCLRTADCHAGGGTCGGVQRTGSNSGPGGIDALMFARTSQFKAQRIGVYDHFVGNVGIATGLRATLIDDNFAREISECGSPFATPATSVCLTNVNLKGGCCYGANNATTSNVQPTTAVTNDVTVGSESQIIRVFGRGSTNAITTLPAGSTSSSQSRIDESTAWPPSAKGPGTAGGGFQVGSLSIVAKSLAQNLASGSTGIKLGASGVNTDSTAIENKLAGAYAIGVDVIGVNGHVTGNNMKSTTGTSTQIGIKVEANITNTDIKTNYIESNATAGAGIQTLGLQTTITGNQIVSVANDTLLYGIEALGTNTGFNFIDGNLIKRVTGACVHLGESAGLGDRVNNNICVNLLSGPITGTIRPACLLLDGPFTQQVTFGNNYCQGNWRNLVGNSFTNANIIGNRFYAYTGAVVDLGNAGVNIVGNYMNSQNFTTWSSSCDSTCTGGTPSTKGVFCGQDSDCTANGNTCNAAVFKCNPEPVIGYFGNMAEVNSPNQHPLWGSNLMFNGFSAPPKQCTVAGAIGQICDVASCAGGATCSGAPSQTCQSGTDSGKRCCQTAAGATCAQRVATDWIVVPDHGAATATSTNLQLIDNILFGGGNGNNYIYLNFMPHGASLGNQGISGLLIAANNWQLPAVAGNIYIQFPTNPPAAFNNIVLTGNNLQPVGNITPIANYQGSFGSLSLVNGAIQRGTATGMGAAAVACGPPPGEFFPVNGTAAVGAEAGAKNIMTSTGTIWKMTCTADAAPGAGNTRVYTLRQNGANTTLTCTIAGATQNECTTAAGAASAPINFVSGDTLDWGDCSTGAAIGGTTTTCTAYLSTNAM